MRYDGLHEELFNIALPALQCYIWHDCTQLPIAPQSLLHARLEECSSCSALLNVSMLPGRLQAALTVLGISS